MGRFSLGGKTFLCKLLANRAGNTLAIAAAALLPMMALIGGGVDVSRAYMAKTQLQSACDSGVLAGRRAMSKTGEYGDAEKAKATKMFNFNFNGNGLDVKNQTFSSDDNDDGQVLGTATATLPTLTMKIFKMTKVDLAVSCMAELQIGNADVMFVLDNTGSMLCAPEDTSDNCTRYSTTDSRSKFYGLKQAVIDFHKTINGAVNDTRTRIRYGFVPYAMTVNVKSLLGQGSFSTADISDTNNYQTRIANFDLTTYVGAPQPNPSTTEETYSSAITQANCGSSANTGNTYGTNKYPTSTNSNPVAGGGPAPAATTSTAYTYKSWSKTGTQGSGSNKVDIGTCKRNKTVTTTTYTTKYGFSGWTYKQAPLTTSSFKGSSAVTVATDISTSTTGYNGAKTLFYPTKTYLDPIQLAAVSGVKTASQSWNGCIEERQTVQGLLDFTDDTTGAYDLDFDTDGTTAATRWHTQWPEQVYLRSTYAGQTWYYNSSTDRYYTNANFTGNAYFSNLYTGSTNYRIGGPQAVYCPAEAKLFDTKYATLSADKTAVPADLTNYLATLREAGGTYHDVGLIWGGRLTSPTGLFKDNVNLDSDKISVSKHLIFMTDGMLAPSSGAYSAYGYEDMDARVAPHSDVGNLYKYHMARFVAMCDAVKAQGTTIWVVAFGTSMTDELKNCASDGRAYYSSNTTALRNTFKFIAAQVADLRLGA